MKFLPIFIALGLITFSHAYAGFLPIQAEKEKVRLIQEVQSAKTLKESKDKLKELNQFIKEAFFRIELDDKIAFAKEVQEELKPLMGEIRKRIGSCANSEELDLYLETLSSYTLSQEELETALNQIEASKDAHLTKRALKNLSDNFALRQGRNQEKNFLRFYDLTLRVESAFDKAEILSKFITFHKFSKEWMERFYNFAKDNPLSQNGVRENEILYLAMARKLTGPSASAYAEEYGTKLIADMKTIQDTEIRNHMIVALFQVFEENYPVKESLFSYLQSKEKADQIFVLGRLLFPPYETAGHLVGIHSLLTTEVFVSPPSSDWRTLYWNHAKTWSEEDQARLLSYRAEDREGDSNFVEELKNQIKTWKNQDLAEKALARLK